MSNSTPDDKLNAPVAKTGRFVQTNTALAVGTVAVTEQDEHFGTFDYVSMFDPAGQEHVVYGEYDVTNNNVVHCVYRLRHLGGTVTERLFILGNSSSITSPDYVKIDSVRAEHHHAAMRISLRGHKIAEGTDNHFRKMGQVGGIIEVPDVWLVFPPNDHKWKHDLNQGIFLPYAQELASISAMSGATVDDFKPEDFVSNSHIAKIVAVGLEHVG